MPEFVYSFQGSNGLYQGHVEVSPDSFNQFQIGQCFTILYLPDNPLISSTKDYLETFDLHQLWSNYLGGAPIAIAAVLFMIVLAIANYYSKKRNKDKTDQFWI